MCSLRLRSDQGPHQLQHLKDKDEFYDVLWKYVNWSPLSVVVNTFAVMGINTAVVQAALLSRAKINSIIPAKIAARLNINEGHFKIQALPISAPEDIAAVQ